MFDRFILPKSQGQIDFCILSACKIGKFKKKYLSQFIFNGKY